MRYETGEDGILRSASDYTYGYAAALRDGVVRPVLFLAYGGAMRWRTKAGDEMAARLGEPLTKDQTAQAWRTALDPKGEWMPAVLAAADTRLSEVRRHVPDAGGLVIAIEPDRRARLRPASCAPSPARTPPSCSPTTPGRAPASRRSRPARSRWMVAVRMVSEGVDVPRLGVGVYATSTSTPLFFAQAVGRFVRARRRGETASVFLPSVPVILSHAATMEEERDHALNRPSSDEAEASLWAEEEGLLAAANRTEQTVGLEESAFEALESDAHFDHVLFDAQQFGLHAAVGSEEEQDYLGLPGLLEPEQVATLLHERQARQTRAAGARGGAAAASGPSPVSAHRALAAQRKELNKLVAAYSSKTGSPHANIHLELRRACGGPELAAATSEQVLERVERIRRWFVGRR